MYTVRRHELVTVCQSPISSELASCYSHSAGEGDGCGKSQEKQMYNLPRLPRQGNSQLASRAVCGQRADVLIPRSYHRSHHISPCLCSRCSKPDRVAHIPRKGRQAAADLQYSRELWCYICGPLPRERERACQDLIRSHLSCPRAGVVCAGQKLDIATAHAI
jgi:hypothetical protein